MQGDVIAIVDKDAQTVARYSYDAWGVSEIKFDSSACQIATINPFRYRSYYFDEEIGLYYLQSRYYDAKIGRFINADMAAILLLNNHSKTKNLFDYCQNSPINSTDAGGNLAAQLIARIIIGIIIGFLVQVISDLIAIWFAKLFGKHEPRINAGDYLSSMLSWALTCVSFSRKSLEFVAVLLPVSIKHVYRAFNRSFDWISLAIDMALAVITILVNKQISKTSRNKLNKIIKKAGTGNKAYNKIRIGKKRLNLKVEVWGIKLNLGINISNFFVSNIYSFFTIQILVKE